MVTQNHENILCLQEIQIPWPPSKILSHLVTTSLAFPNFYFIVFIHFMLPVSRMPISFSPSMKLLPTSCKAKFQCHHLFETLFLPVENTFHSRVHQMQQKYHSIHIFRQLVNFLEDRARHFNISESAGLKRLAAAQK